MMVFLVAVWLQSCGAFSSETCVESKVIGGFVTLKHCRESASAYRKIEKMRAGPAVYLCLEDGI